MAAVRQADLPTQLDASYDETFRKLAGMFRARGLRSEDAADLAQEAATRALVHLSRHGKQRADLTPLLVTIARNLLVERYRSSAVQLVELEEHHSTTEGTDVSDTVAERELTHQVQAAVGELSPRHRRALSMWLDGHRPPAIASELGIKRNAADALLYRARRQLAQRLESCRGLLAGAFAPIGLRLRRGAQWAESVGIWAMREQIALLCAAVCAAILPVAAVKTPVETPRVRPAVATATAPAPTKAAVPAAAKAVGPATAAVSAKRTSNVGEVHRRYGGGVCTEGVDGEPAPVQADLTFREDGEPSPVYELVTKVVPVPKEVTPYVALAPSCQEESP